MADIWSFKSGRTGVEFDSESGTFDIRHGETAIFSGATVGALVRRGKRISQAITPGPWQVERTGAEGLSVFRREDWGTAFFKVEPAGTEGLALRLGLLWESDDEPPGIDAMIPLEVPAGGIWSGRESAAPLKAYVHGWQCWTPTAALSGDRPGDHLLPLFLPKKLKAMVANPGTPVSSERGSFESEWFTAIADVQRGDSVVVGFAGVSEALSRISMRLGRRPTESRMEALWMRDGVPLKRGAALFTEPLVVLPGDLTSANLEEYAEVLARAHGGPPSPGHAPAGWCSWYRYKRDISEKTIAGNLERLATRFKGLGIGLVQIDDGYAPEVGDWLETTERFPGGMAPVARAIVQRGCMPGIWVAPFTVTRRSRIFKEKKHWLQRNARGRPVLAGVSPDWGGRFYGLDLTHPEVLDWLREVFSTLADYGYRFFKLDFMACGLLEGRRFDGSVTRASAARNALSVIRGAVGKDAYIMAAGGPVLLGTGILNAQRISGDVAGFWSKPYQRALRDRATPGVRNSLINTMTRAFMSGRLFEGDPDCLLARTAGSELTADEKRTLASAIAVLGGAFMVSDDTGMWGAGELELLSRCLPHGHGTARCPDLWRREVPMYLSSPRRDAAGEYFLVLAVNWARRAADVEAGLEEMGLPPGRWHACELWTGEYLGETTESVMIRGVGPHGCALLRLTPAEDRPRLIASSLNLSGGACEMKTLEARDGGLRIELEAPTGGKAEVTLAVPGGGEMSAAMMNEVGVEVGAVRVDRLSTSVYRLSFTMPEGGVRIALTPTD